MKWNPNSVKIYTYLSSITIAIAKETQMISIAALLNIQETIFRLEYWIYLDIISSLRQSVKEDTASNRNILNISTTVSDFFRLVYITIYYSLVLSTRLIRISVVYVKELY